MEVYGQTGTVLAPDGRHLRVRHRDAATDQPEQTVAAPPAPYDEPFACLAAVVRGTAPEHMLSSLSANLLVVEIPEAARQSAREGKTVYLPK